MLFFVLRLKCLLDKYEDIRNKKRKVGVSVYDCELRKHIQIKNRRLPSVEFHPSIYPISFLFPKFFKISFLFPKFFKISFPDTFSISDSYLPSFLYSFRARVGLKPSSSSSSSSSSSILHESSALSAHLNSRAESFRTLWLSAAQNRIRQSYVSLTLHSFEERPFRCHLGRCLLLQKA